MDYVKSSDQELGAVIEHCGWVEGMDIGYWILDIGVGTGSNTVTASLVLAFPTDDD